MNWGVCQALFSVSFLIERSRREIETTALRIQLRRRTAGFGELYFACHGSTHVELRAILIRDGQISHLYLNVCCVALLGELPN